MENEKGNKISILRILKNISYTIVTFLILYVVFNTLFVATILRPADYFNNGVGMGVFFRDYIKTTIYDIIPIFIVSIKVTMCVLAAMRIYKYKTAVISIFIVTLMLSVYPTIMMNKGDTYKIDFRKYKPKNSRTGENFLYDVALKTNTITSVNNYSLYVKEMPSNNRYKNVMLNKMGVNEPIYLANKLVIDKDSMSLKDIVIINNSNKKVESTSAINIKFLENNPVKDFEVSISGVFMLEYISAIVYKFIYYENPLYSSIIMFILFFLFYIGSYMLIASISSPIHIMHNMLSVILLYYVITNILYYYSNKYDIMSFIESTSMQKMAIYILIYDIVLIVLSLLLRKLFSFNKYYTSIENA